MRHFELLAASLTASTVPAAAGAQPYSHEAQSAAEYNRSRTGNRMNAQRRWQEWHSGQRADQNQDRRHYGQQSTARFGRHQAFGGRRINRAIIARYATAGTTANAKSARSIRIAALRGLC